MNTEPLATALREIAEAKSLLETLIVSSEEFDYMRAKEVLKALNAKIRDLGREKSRLEQVQKSRARRAPNIFVVDFGKSQSAPAPQGSSAP